MKRGFTLIELLAVILILGIISLIAIPAISNIIDEAKFNAATRSAENYIKAVESAVSRNIVVDEITPTKCEIQDYNTLICDEESELKINYKGNGIKEGTLYFSNGIVKNIRNGKIDNLFVKIVSDKVKLFKENPESELVYANIFNSKIKQFFEDSKNNDDVLRNIKFLSYGELPEGYTLEQLNEFDSIDLSDKKDNSIKAFYNGNGSIFIYSEKLIVFKSANQMFDNFYDIENIDFGYVDTSNVTSMNDMFNDCYNLETVNLSSFDTSNVTNFYMMFWSCKKLKTLNLNHFNTSNATSFGYMFSHCQSLEEVLVNNFDVSNATTLISMFEDCPNLKSLNLSSFNTSNVTVMDNMFSSCRSLTELNLSNFNVSNVTNMTNFLYNNSNLKMLDISSFVFKDSINISNVFIGLPANMTMKVNSLSENKIRNSLSNVNIIVV
ncbi:MAG: BspA family leucine-rich repeat surface protein [Bacilli bacterium]|nr:BspA family leucine-rich repeat surface protein [Bacilli bacterium]